MKRKIKKITAISKLKRSNRRIYLSIGFALLGLTLLAITAASAAVTYFEAETSSITGTATIESDGQASSGQFLKFGSDSAVVSADYYVATNGSDTNPGTQASPFKTITKALSVVTAGKTILVKSGTYTGDFTISKSGSDGSPITLSGEPGTKLVTNKSQSKASIWIKASYVTLKNFDITGNVHVLGHYNIVEKNYIHDSHHKGGVHFTASTRNGSDGTNNIVQDNTIVKTVGTGVYLEGRDHKMLRNDISRIVDHSADHAVQTDADGMRFFGSGHLVKNNYIHDIWHEDQLNLPHIDLMQTYQEAHHIVFDSNIMHSPNKTASNRILMLARHAGSGPVSDLVWVNNIFIFEDDSSPHLNFKRDLSVDMPEIVNMIVVNNVFYSFGKVEKIASVENIDNAIIKNNLVINTGLKSGVNYIMPQGYTSTAGFGNNLVYNTDGTTPKGPAFPGDLWGINPQVISLTGTKLSDLNFRPKSGSPLIDAGIFHNYTTVDYDGIFRPQGSGFDIGAFEFK